MKTSRPLLIVLLLLLHLVCAAQVQWYQNQDGNNPPPNGTIATSIQKFTRSSFVACYLWRVEGGEFIWKISRTNLSGREEKHFFISGPTALVEIKTGDRNTVYLLKRDFPAGQPMQVSLYKLDANLNVVKQKTVEYGNGFTINSINAFEVDDDENIYLAGNGVYALNGSINPGSYILKTDRSLAYRWKRIDSSETNYSRILVDKWGFVNVIQNHQNFFPDIRITKISPNGQWSFTKTIAVTAGRFDLNAALDEHNNILLYGAKSIGDTAQGIFLDKISGYTGRVLYRKTLFNCAGASVNDLKTDDHGNIYTLVYQYFGPGDERCRISRISSFNGSVQWSRSLTYAEDSCYLYKLVMNGGERFFAIGERKKDNIFSKAYAVQLKKNGVLESKITSPDSTGFQKSHWLSEGIMDNDDKLISVGNTMDLDPLTWGNTYLRAFAVRFNAKKGCDDDKPGLAQQNNITEEAAVKKDVVVYPNPAYNRLSITNLNPEEQDAFAVYTLSGVLMKQQKITGSSEGIDVSKFPEGVYLLVIKSPLPKPQKTIRFIVQH